MYISVYICSIYININIGGITFHSFNNKQLLYMIYFHIQYILHTIILSFPSSFTYSFLNFFFIIIFLLARRHFWSFSRLNSLNIYNIIQSYTILYSPLHQIFINANTILISNILLLNLLINHVPFYRLCSGVPTFNDVV